MRGKRRFGRVRELPSGRWQARYKGPDGIDRPAPRTFDSKTSAERWLTLTEAEIIGGDWIDPDAGRVLYGKYASDWIEERPGLRPKTAELYRYLLRRHLGPAFDARPVAEIREPHVRRWRKDLLDAGVSPVTVAKAYRLLKAIFNTAVDDGLIRRNPCRIKGAGLEKSAERPVLTVSQVYALADAADERYRALVLLAAFSSLRWGELAALRRSDIDIEARTVRVVRQLNERDGAGFAFGPPKSEADGPDGALHEPGRDGVPARRQRAAAGHRGRAEQAGSRAAGPVRGEAIGHATGTAAPVGIMTACPVRGKMLPDLGFQVCAPTATRTRDLLLRRHFRSVPGQCWVRPDVPFGCGENGWRWPGVALCLRSLAPRLAPRDPVSNANVRMLMA